MAFGDGTRVVRAGVPEPRQGQPLLPGPELASLYAMSGEPDGYGYAREGNRTWARYEAALGELEGGAAVVFPSGMAACTAVLLANVKPGDTAVLPADGYPAVRAVAERHLGADLRLVPSGPSFADHLDGAAFVFAESPSNPGLEVCDLRELCTRAHDQGALVAVDNTLATPLGQRPLDLGADFSVSSDTKYMSGHSDLLLGHVAVRDEALAGQLEEWRETSGSVPGPFETWLAHRSLPTLDVRLDRQCTTALELAELIATIPGVTGVRYPGRPADPAFDIASRQMSRFGAVICFDLGSRGRAERFLARCDLITEATSFGGVHSTAERRARWAGNDVPEGFIRLSVGLEDAADLVADIESAVAGLS